MPNRSSFAIAFGSVGDSACSCHSHRNMSFGHIVTIAAGTTDRNITTIGSSRSISCFDHSFIAGIVAVGFAACFRRLSCSLGRTSPLPPRMPATSAEPA